ncbi:amino acid adenylation domain-containing protein [Streptomyces sp. NPDC020719]|uniref:non-ribosomal peptide synthetase n=1 Tax=Streptomyces sp. NPDC020719 TaxID=3154896 RepID=UPI0033FB3952
MHTPQKPQTPHTLQASEHPQPSRAFPLTEAQLGLMAIHRSVPARNLYNIVIEFTLDPGFSSQDVRTALAAVAEVQPALRLGLGEVPVPHAELVAPLTPENVPLSVHVARPDEFAVTRAVLLDELGAHAFTLNEPPLFTAAHLARRGEMGDAVLLLAVHHTVFDGFSAGPFVRDLNAALEGTLDTRALAPVREAALRAEVEAQLAAADDEDVAQEARELAARLRSVPATELYPRPGRPTRTDFSGARHELPLSAEESAAVDETCRRLGVTPFTFFSAVYAAVLARHSGNASATFGATLMSRRTLDSFDLCGFFVNTLPLSVPVDWDAPFAEFVAKVVDEEVEDTKFRTQLPFSRVVEQYAPDRTSDRNPVFSALLAMQDSTVTAPGAPVRGVRQHGNGAAKFDVLLFATPTADGWLLELEHDRTLLPAPVAGALADSLRQALTRASTASDTSTVAGLFEDCAHHDAPPARPLPYATVYEWVMATAAAHPERTAVIEEGAPISYGQLVRRVDAVAGGLARRGVGPGGVVGVATRGLTDTVVTVLAALARRAAYLPLDSQLPTERLAMMINQARCRLVVGAGESAFAGTDVTVARPADLAAEGARDGRPQVTGRGPDDPVYTMFTSGSTGRPKGVLMGNGALVNLTDWQLGVLGMDGTTRFLQYAPIGFDVSFQEIFPTLVSGGTLVSREPVDRRDLPALVRRVAETGVTHLYLPVAALRPFALAAEDLGERLPGLRHICVAGEQLQADTSVQRFFELRPHIRLFNMYGPTETHVVTAQELTRDTLPWPVHVPIGRPLPGVTAQVVDVTGHLAPLGVTGELLLGGRCPALGYVNDPERTAERFVPDPYGNGPDARRYRTGDQVFRDEHGVLVYAGRDDDQVKIRGYRVELGELESAATALPGVRAAVAATHKDGVERQLLLFVVADEAGADESTRESAIRDALAARLPSYMHPAHVLTVDSIPTSHNGKLDRAALLRRLPELLADRAQDGPAAPAADGGPASPLETELCALWAELLGGDVPVDGSLVEHGAHSLNVLTALARIEQRHGVQITILDFFRTPTVRALAELITLEGKHV